MTVEIQKEIQGPLKGRIFRRRSTHQLYMVISGEHEGVHTLCNLRTGLVRERDRSHTRLANILRMNYIEVNEPINLICSDQPYQLTKRIEINHPDAIYVGFTQTRVTVGCQTFSQSAALELEEAMIPYK